VCPRAAIIGQKTAPGNHDPAFIGLKNQSRRHLLHEPVHRVNPLARGPRQPMEPTSEVRRVCGLDPWDQVVTQTIAREPPISVAGVLAVPQPRRSGVALDLRPPEGKQRPNDARRAPRRDPGQAPDARAPREPEEYRLRLVVRLMGRRQQIGAELATCSEEEIVAEVASPGLAAGGPPRPT
jgi:hypothetical protein